MSKQFLTLEDLHSLFSSKKRSYHFSSQKTGAPIVVQVEGLFEAGDDVTEGLMPVTLKACHIDENRNGSYISKENMEKALPSFKNRPILGHIIQLDSGEYDFHTHDMEIDKDGNFVYIERPVGIIPESCNARLVYDEEMDKTYVVVDGYIFEDYGNQAANILRDKTTRKVSVELYINELTYNAKEKRLELEDFYFNGVTILGSEEDGTPIGEGMLGSKITIDSFSAENNSLVLNSYQETLVELLEELVSNFNIKNNIEKGGKDSLTKFEELLKKYDKKVEDIEFVYEGLSDEELENKFAEAFAEAEENTDVDTDVKKGNEEENFAEEENSEVYLKTFEISHEDVRYALYELLAPYEEADNEWYYILNVYDSYFDYQGYDKIYRQNYAKEGDNVALEGERMEMYRELLTASEHATLEEMRSNYDALKEFKEEAEKAELNTQKQDILAAEDYSVLSENEEFQALSKELDDYSLEELAVKADLIYAKHMKTVKNFAQDEGESTGTKQDKIYFNINNEPDKKAYGTLFDE